MEASEGIAFLTERIDAIERERDNLLVKSQRLEMLQRSFVDIIAASDERTLASAAMRGAWLGLGFSRALWFRIEGSSELTALYELDGGTVDESEYGGTLPDSSALYRVLSGDSNTITGFAGDSDDPLFDTRRRFAAAAVRPQSGETYVLYVDGSNERAASAWSVASLQELATHATFALERLRMATELERLAMRDPLTGLFNRRALMERLTVELATVRRTGDTLAFAMIDVDDFKRINDTRGHAGGDDALKTIASILESETRETDVAARFAGDEFSLIMPRSDRAAVDAVMTRIYAALASNDLRCSIGIAFAHKSDDRERLVSRADEAVYASKAAGKNCYRIADASS
jgi:diguanylate cyclase (GGDEF)-like protein